MKTTLRYRRFENMLFAVIAFITGARIHFHYTTSLPDFDIALNDAFITFRCGMLAIILWGVTLFLFRFIGRQVTDSPKRQLIKIAAVLVYGLIVWGICYYQCAIKAVRDWNDMMNGNVG